MKKFPIVAVVSLVLLSAVAIAQDDEGPHDKAIKGRQAVFQVYSYNMGLMSAMAKGKMEYNAEIASDAAANLLAAATMKNGTMWPAGSDNTNPENATTRALPAIWETYPEINEHGKKLVAAAEALVPVAGTGLVVQRLS